MRVGHWTRRWYSVLLNTTSGTRLTLRVQLVVATKYAESLMCQSRWVKTHTEYSTGRTDTKITFKKLGKNQHFRRAFYFSTSLRRTRRVNINCDRELHLRSGCNPQKRKKTFGRWSRSIFSGRLLFKWYFFSCFFFFDHPDFAHLIQSGIDWSVRLFHGNLKLQQERPQEI